MDLVRQTVSGRSHRSDRRPEDEERRESVGELVRVYGRPAGARSSSCCAGPSGAAALRAGSFPILARVTARPDVDLTMDTLFEFGLERTLDGIAALLATHAR
ncbi:hypothetical protein [Micromonospora pisi]|uniref:hypothetical protein n=1 Tax=Micromonospora pisi TaxID=589240 RepID=UPI000EB162E4|nr:hypothetical protein [Micromonospora pisi]